MKTYILFETLENWLTSKRNPPDLASARMQTKPNENINKEINKMQKNISCLRRKTVGQETIAILPKLRHVQESTPLTN